MDEWLDRFVVKMLDGCWIWTGPLDKDGYARMTYGGGQVRAHRVVLTRALGRDLRPGMFACHSCDVRACVRPDHLWEGTHFENDADAEAKGRMAHGNRHYNARLTEDDVRSIRARYESGESQASISREFGVDQSNISFIVRRLRWKHVA